MAKPRTLGQRVTIWARNIMLGLIVAAFVVVFGQPGGGGSAQSVAEVDGETVGRDEFEYFRSVLEARQEEYLGPNADPAQVQDFLDNNTRESMLRRFILAREARQMELRVTDDEIVQNILGDPRFQPAGRFDPELFESFVARSFGSERTYRDALRRDLLIQKLRRVYLSPIRVSDEAARTWLRREGTTVRLRFAAARADAFQAKAQVTDEEVAEFVTSRAPDLRREYEARNAEYNRPEQARARHILFKGDDARTRADAALARIQGGADFSALATELSEDPATASQGGDLGTFPRGRMFPEFDAAVFAAEAGAVVGPVESDRGVQLIRVEERIAGVSQGFEVVRDTLARSLLQASRGSEAASTAANSMAALLAQGVDFDAAAEKAGLEVDQTTPFQFSSRLVPGIGQVAGLRAEAFRLTEQEPVSTRVFGSQGAFYLISLASREEPDSEALEAGLEPARERMLAEARGSVLERLYDRRRQELQNSGKLTLYALYPDR